MTTHVCESCGARLEAGDAVCQLCGTPTGLPVPSVGSVLQPSREGAEDRSTVRSHDQKTPAPSAAGPIQEGHRFCTQCGKPILPEARFCAWCGAAVPDGSAAEPPVFEGVAGSQHGDVALGDDAGLRVTKVEEPKKVARKQSQSAPAQTTKDVNKRVITLVAAGITAVVGLFMVSLLLQGTSPSARPDRTPSEEGSASPVIALPADVEQSARTLRAQAEAATGAEEKEAALRSLVHVYASAGRFDLAAAVQEEVALDVGSAEEWAAAGNLHFDWMEGTAPGAEKEVAARKAVQAYTRSLEIDSTNNDVRTDRAVAYLNDAATAMTAIEEVNKVLASDPGHLQANFNKAVMMSMIGRQEQALEFYRKVVELADPASPMYIEARRRVDELTASGG